MNILFVPFLTDTQNAYTRVKHCAQARVENERGYCCVTHKTTWMHGARAIKDTDNFVTV
jgi:hypothetical protein